MNISYCLHRPCNQIIAILALPLLFGWTYAEPIQDLSNLTTAALVTETQSDMQDIALAESLWTEDFEAFPMGDLLSQDPSWQQVIEDELEITAAEISLVETSQVLNISAGSSVAVPHWRSNHVFKKVETVGITEDMVKIRFRMRHNFNGEYKGLIGGVKLVSQADDGAGGSKAPA